MAGGRLSYSWKRRSVMGKGKMTQTGKTTQTTELPPWATEAYKKVATAAGNQVFDPVTGEMKPFQTYQGPLTPEASANWKQWQAGAGQIAQGAPQYDTVKNLLMDSGALMGMQQQNPQAFQITGSYAPERYQPGQFTAQNVQFNDPFAGFNKADYTAAPITAPTIGATDFTAQQYNFNPERVAAERISAPGRGEIRDVSAGLAQAYLMEAPPEVQAQQLSQYQMVRPEDVTAGTVTTNAFTDEGVRQKYMDPYIQDVIDRQTRAAKEAFGEQLAQTQGSAAAAGAYGGTRQAVLETGMRRDLANQMGDITARGLEGAYQNAQQQYERDRAASMGTQQFNVEQGLRAALANQQTGFATGQTNLNALLSTQQLGSEQAMRAALANQQAAIVRGQSNQQALNQAQQIGLDYGLRAALANQQADIGYAGMGMEAARANPSTGSQALQGNQTAGLQATVRGAELGQSDRQFGANLLQQRKIRQAELGMEGLRANQQAQIAGNQLGFSALENQYRGNLQAGLANQQAGQWAQQQEEGSRQFGAHQWQQEQQCGANFRIQQQTPEQQARNQMYEQNLAAFQAQADAYGRVAGLDTQGYQNQLAAQNMLSSAAQGQYGFDQAGINAAYNQYMLAQNYPMMQLGQYANILGQATQPFATTVGQQYGIQAPWWQQVVGAGMTAASMIPGMGK